MRCPRCGGFESGLSTTMTSNEDPAARWQSECSDCGYRWVHPLRIGWAAPVPT